MTNDARRLLNALRRAGCSTFVEDGMFFCSPPSRPIDWPGDVEEDLSEYHDELLELLLATTETIH